MSGITPSGRMAALTVVCAVLAVICVGCGSNGGGPTRMRVAAETSAPDPEANFTKKFAERAKEKVGDELDVTLELGGTLGDAEDLQEQAQAGSIEVIGVTSTVPIASQRFALFDLPYLFTDREQVYKALDGEIGEKLNRSLVEESGLRVLGSGELGFRQITNRVRPIRTPEDLKGLKIRVPSNDIRIAALEAFGANPSSLDFSELYSALQQGVVDGQENPLSAILGASFAEVQKYLTIANYIYTPTYVLVNEAWWQTLSPEVRSGLEEAADEAVRWSREQGRQADERAVEQLRRAGMAVNTADQASFLAPSKEIWAKFEDVVGADLIDAAIALRREGS